MSERVYFRPKYGVIYENHGGGHFKCIDRHPLKRGREWNAVFQNIKSGWILLAHDVRQYPDGRIDWAYSTGGHWPRGGKYEKVQMEQA